MSFTQLKNKDTLELKEKSNENKIPTSSEPQSGGGSTSKLPERDEDETILRKEHTEKETATEPSRAQQNITNLQPTSNLTEKLPDNGFVIQEQADRETRTEKPTSQQNSQSTVVSEVIQDTTESNEEVPKRLMVHSIFASTNKSQTNEENQPDETTFLWDAGRTTDLQVTIVPSSVTVPDSLFPANVFLPENPKEKDERDTPTKLLNVQNMYRQNLEEVDEELRQEEQRLLQERGRLERQTATITDQMYQEAQALLRLFGIPFVASPAEAEAQCAQLETVGLSQGTITDDSDVWLFGGSMVYKNFFTQGKYVEAYDIKNIASEFGLGQKMFICFAMLTGSDYTEGLQNVGHVTAMEILGEFSGEGMKALQDFREWWDFVQKHQKPAETKTRSKLRKLTLAPGFPNSVVYNAYLNPEVDKSEERFSWGLPDLQSLREFAEEKFGWTKKKIDEMLLPVMKRVAERQSQTRLDSFLQIGLKRERDLFPSKRLQKAVKRIRSQAEPNLSESSSSSDLDDPLVTITTKRKKRVS